MVVTSTARLRGAMIVGTVLCGMGVAPQARGDAIYNITYLGDLGPLTPIGLDNQGRAYVEQNISTPYRIPNPPYSDRTGYTSLTKALRYEPTGPNAGTFTDLGASVPKGPDQTGVPTNPASSQLLQVASNGQALVTTSQGDFLTDGTTVKKIAPLNLPGQGTTTPVGSGGGVTVVNAFHSVPEGAYTSSRQDVFVQQNGTTTMLALPGGQEGVAIAVGGGGQIVGQMWSGPSYNPTPWHAFLSQNGKVTDLGSLGGGWSMARAVNALGQVIGESTTSTTINPPWYTVQPVYADHAFLYSNGQMKDLGTLGNDKNSIAFAINGKGQVVGQSGVEEWPTSEKATAFLFDGQKMLDLNSLVKFQNPGSHLSVAIAINDLGQILAEGLGDRGYGVMLLTPVDQPVPPEPPVLVPEPSSLAIFGVLAGAAALRQLARGRRGGPGDNRPS